jgi:two-component system, LytTR family, sensor kinase
MLVSAAWLVPAAFGALNRYAQGRISDSEPATAVELLFASGDWLLYAIITPAVFAISRRWPLARPNLRRRVAFHLAMSLLFCVVWATAGKILQFLLRWTFDNAALRAQMARAGFWQMAGRDLVSWIFTTLPFGVAVYLCMVGIEHAARYFVDARDREVQVARLSDQLTGARLSALQARLNPHFLFNSLNTIAVLVRGGDRDAATSVIEQLSEVLRTTLGRAGANEVSLDDELTLVRQYLAVEQARFSDRLRPTVDVAPSLLSAAVPSFAIQHLVENAVRHGIARQSDGGRLAVVAARNGEWLEVTVSDDGPGVAPDAPMPPGHGISDTRDRLRSLYGDRASLTLEAAPARGAVARLRIPYHELLHESPADAVG